MLWFKYIQFISPLGAISKNSTTYKSKAVSLALHFIPWKFKVLLNIILRVAWPVHLIQQNCNLLKKHLFFTWNTELLSVSFLDWNKDTNEASVLTHTFDPAKKCCTFNLYNCRDLGLGFPWDSSAGISPYLGGPPNVPSWFLSNGNPTLSLLPSPPLCKIGAPGFGLLMTPMKIGTWVLSSIRAKKKGWLRWNTGLDAREMTTVVAAAASAPSSFISMVDLCITLETSRGPSAISARLGLENIPPRPKTEQGDRVNSSLSVACSKKTMGYYEVLPNLVKTSCSSWPYSNLNLGTLTWTALSFGRRRYRSEIFSFAESEDKFTWPDMGMTTNKFMDFWNGKLATCAGRRNSVVMKWRLCRVFFLTVYSDDTVFYLSLQFVISK